MAAGGSALFWQAKSGGDPCEGAKTAGAVRADAGEAEVPQQLVLAVVNPARQFTLLDSTAKKLKFIEHTSALLELPNVQTVHTRAENFRPAQRFDIVLSRAVGPGARPNRSPPAPSTQHLVPSR